ncbi:hypothetical protein D9743_06495 [Staphylococcus aureus]|nr:hypothetical protein [Staphylococcus aureus]MRF35016.1 hypothetical protein [Staphylococcus sp. KY49P]HAR4210068.1 hypothetical protein [Staphylococcus aureus ADL-210]HAR4234987.1 hypothetical protein [Staphylococcus aureus ADL-206]MBD6800165.1 hypothetical protein [Staphylococcus aureus]
MLILLLISKNHLSMYGWMIYFAMLSVMNFLISVVKYTLYDSFLE